MILSDVSIRKALSEGRIEIDPLDDAAIQPSSVDLRVDRYFRVFRNDTTPFIDPKENQENLTELVEVPDEGRFILHPGEFVLGSTLERVKLPDDMVARLEGKSSLGRLGLLIHSSLPGDERILIREAGHTLAFRTIGEIVSKRLEAEVVAFDRETHEVGFHAITGWYEGPADRIYEVRLASGRSVRVTAGHNLFSLDRDGEIVKTRTLALRPGVRVAIPRTIPEPFPGVATVELDVAHLAPEHEYDQLLVEGPGVRRAIAHRRAEIIQALRDHGYSSPHYYVDRARLPLAIALTHLDIDQEIGTEDRLHVRGGSNGIPLRITVDEELAWYVGLYVAEGSRRRNQVTVSNTDPAILDRAAAVLERLGLPVHRGNGVVVACSGAFERLISWLGVGDRSPDKRVPDGWLSLPDHLLDAFLAGLVDGDGNSHGLGDDTRTSVWACSDALVDDLLYLASRLGRRAGSCHRDRPGTLGLHQVCLPHREHKLLTSVPLPDRLLIAAREAAGLDQATAARAAGYRHASELDNLERRSGRDAVRRSTLQRLLAVYDNGSDASQRLARLVDGDLLWDTVTEVVDTGRVEPIYDIEVRPGRRPIENFVAGSGGVFVSNTAGFVDASWNGYLTLELSNVANLPIAIYPGMKIGQISFLQMTTSAEHPYGSSEAGSKYQGQRGPTPSRYYLNFHRKDD